MGIARLLAKGWTVFCIFAAAHALRFVPDVAVDSAHAIWAIAVSASLFTAMGLLFIAGFAAAGEHDFNILREFKPAHFLPSFDDAAFFGFAALSYLVQILATPNLAANAAARGLHAAIHFAVPGQRALESASSCGLDAGQVFAAAFAWLLAIIYIASAGSRVRLAAGLLRIARARRYEFLSPGATAAILGFVALAGFQLLYIGTGFGFLQCGAYRQVSGALLIGLAPLMLAYVMVAAAVNLVAVGAE